MYKNIMGLRPIYNCVCSRNRIKKLSTLFKNLKHYSNRDIDTHFTLQNKTNTGDQARVTGVIFNPGKMETAIVKIILNKCLVRQTGASNIRLD